MNGQDGQWKCQRTRIGKYVTEKRFRLPRFYPGEPPDIRLAKERTRNSLRASPTKNVIDRMEMRLAALGPQAVQYQMTFDNCNLPPTFADLRRCFRAFRGRIGRYRDGDPLDLIYAMEGLHGDKRYHVHLMCRPDEMPLDDLRRLWRYGIVFDPEPVLKFNPVRNRHTGKVELQCQDGYHRLAYYFVKERLDGVKFPVGCHPFCSSRSLSAKVPPAEVWFDASGDIDVPEDNIWVRRESKDNYEFGGYSWAKWIEK